MRRLIFAVFWQIRENSSPKIFLILSTKINLRGIFVKAFFSTVSVMKIFIFHSMVANNSVRTSPVILQRSVFSLYYHTRQKHYISGKREIIKISSSSKIIIRETWQNFHTRKLISGGNNFIFDYSDRIKIIAYLQDK